jgi:hypothetical protein
MEDLTLPSIWASFKKWRCCTNTLLLPRSLGPCYMQGPLKNKKQRRTIPFYKKWLAATCQAATGRATPQVGYRWLLAWRPRVAADPSDPWSSGGRLPPISGRLLVATWAGVATNSRRPPLCRCPVMALQGGSTKLNTN